MDRQIVCFGVPSLEIALARLADRALRNRPIGIAPLNLPRTVLHEVSPEAERDGIYPGMPIQQAAKLCRTLRILAPNPNRVSDAQRALLGVMAHYAPVCEPTRPGSFLLDLTGTTRLFGLTCDTAIRIQQDVSTRFNLDGVLGIGSNRLVAQTAAGLVQPTQLYEVRYGSERAFMAPLPVQTLPLLHRPQMKSARQRLADLNLHTFGDLADIPLPALQLAVGMWAILLLRWAQGIDSTPVMPPPIQPYLKCSHLLQPDDIDDHVVWGYLADLLEHLCRTLRTQQRVCQRLTLTVHYDDHTDVARSQPVEPASYWDTDLTPPLRILFKQCFRRRIRIRALTLAATGLVASVEQCRLFDDTVEATRNRRARAQQLSLALDRLKTRFGDRIIHYGRGA